MRLRRCLAAALAAASAGLAAPRAARAQFQTCAAGTLASYLQPSFSCQLESVFFLGFGYDPSGTGADGSGSAAAPDPAAVDVTPFVRTDALGRTTLGFSFTNLAATAAVGGGAAGPGTATGTFELRTIGFSLERLLSGAGLSLALDAATGTPDLTALTTDAGGTVGALPLVVCFDNGVGADGPTSLTPERDEDCDTPVPIFLAFYGAEATAERGDSPLTAAGTARAGITEVRFTLAQVVPEPGTFALAAAGLAAALAAGRAARRRTA